MVLAMRQLEQPMSLLERNPPSLISEIWKFSLIQILGASRMQTEVRVHSHGRDGPESECGGLRRSDPCRSRPTTGLQVSCPEDTQLQRFCPNSSGSNQSSSHVTKSKVAQVGGDQRIQRCGELVRFCCFFDWKFAARSCPLLVKREGSC